MLHTEAAHQMRMCQDTLAETQWAVHFKLCIAQCTSISAPTLRQESCSVAAVAAVVKVHNALLCMQPGVVARCRVAQKPCTVSQEQG
jgi:hypothetical protein